MLMFIIIAGALYLRFRGAHRVPGHVAFTSSRWARAGSAPGTVNFGDARAQASAEPQAAVKATGAPEEAAVVPADGSEQAHPADEQARSADERANPADEQAGPADKDGE
jgi:hypothetical protein